MNDTVPFFMGFCMGDIAGQWWQYHHQENIMMMSLGEKTKNGTVDDNKIKPGYRLTISFKDGLPVSGVQTKMSGGAEFKRAIIFFKFELPNHDGADAVLASGFDFQKMMASDKLDFSSVREAKSSDNKKEKDVVKEDNKQKQKEQEQQQEGEGDDDEYEEEHEEHEEGEEEDGQ